MVSNPLHYWDSCIFIAWLTGEKRAQEELDGIDEMASKVHSKEVRLITSAQTQAEVLASTLTHEQEDKFKAFMRRRNCIEAQTDRRVWTLSREIRDFYQIQSKKDGLPTVSTPDAVHLATAILYRVDVLFTFDKNNKPNKQRGLVPLSGQVCGGKYNLIIEVPYAAQMRLI